MTISEGEVAAAIASMLRAGALTVTAPVIGDAGVPARAKLVFVVAVGLAIGLNRAPVALGDLPATAVLELAAGIVTGLVARFVMARAAIAGQLIGLSLGLGFASEYDVNAGENAGVIRTMATTIASLAFLSVGGLEAVVRGVAAGPAQLSHFAALGPQLLTEGTAAFGRGFALAAPIVLAALVGNLGLAVLNRAVPSINVFSISLASVLIIGGLTLLATSASFANDCTALARDAAARLYDAL
jgi:flagellar biosynthesis protein FliR